MCPVPTQDPRTQQYIFTDVSYFVSGGYHSEIVLQSLQLHQTSDRRTFPSHDPWSVPGIQCKTSHRVTTPIKFYHFCKLDSQIGVCSALWAVSRGCLSATDCAKMTIFLPIEFLKFRSSGWTAELSDLQFLERPGNRHSSTVCCTY